MKTINTIPETAPLTVEQVAKFIREDMYGYEMFLWEDLCSMAGLEAKYAAAADDSARWEVTKEAAQILNVRVVMTHEEYCDWMQGAIYGSEHFSGETLEGLNAEAWA